MASRPPARCVMVLGTTSGAGKSWLATALCRHYTRQGLKVAPFKAQNMSNNARVVGEGEIGSAQFLQALAAKAEPDVRMNPLLLKPESDTHSQVVLMGQVSAELTAMPWRGRGEQDGVAHAGDLQKGHGNKGLEKCVTTMHIGPSRLKGGLPARRGIVISVPQPT